MNSLTAQEIKLFSQEFQKELERLHESHESPSHWARMIMPRHKVFEIIQHLKGIAVLPPGKPKTWIVSRKFKVFNKPSMGLADVLMEPTKDKLSLSENSGTVFPRYLAVVPREDIFETLLKIHLENNHSTLRETLHLVRGKISNIPRYLVHKFILLCPICSNNGTSTNSSGLPYTPSRRCVIKARRRRKLMDQFQVDVLDLNSNPDGAYSYILHCMDHITGFHWLFPLAKIDPAEVAQNLVWGIFSLFGFPTELISDYGKEFASEVIEQVTKLWPDELHIKNYLEGSSYKGEVTRRNTRNVTRFIDDMAEKKSEIGDNRLKWSEWLPEIQFMINATVLDVRTGKTPYEKVFRTHPVTNVPKAKFGTRKYDNNNDCGSDFETTFSRQRSASQRYNDDLLLQQQQNQQQQQLVTEEIVEHHDMMQQHHVDMNNVVVVDMGGIEHSVSSEAEEPLTGVVVDVGQEDNNADAAAAVVSAGYTFDTIETTEGTTYTIVPSADSVDTVGTTYVMASNQDYFSSSNSVDHLHGHVEQIITTAESPNFVSEIHDASNSSVVSATSLSAAAQTVEVTTVSQGPFSSKLDQLRLDDEEYMDTKNTPEKWVTLSADGGDLEVAEIKPTIQEVRIAAGGNKGYRINPVTRKAAYVTEKSSPSRGLVEKISAKTVSRMSDGGSGSRMKGFKAFSPVKSERVIQFSTTSNSKNTTRLYTSKDSPQKTGLSTLSRNEFFEENLRDYPLGSSSFDTVSNPSQILYSKPQLSSAHQTSKKRTLPPSFKLTSTKKIKLDKINSSNVNTSLQAIKKFHVGSITASSANRNLLKVTSASSLQLKFPGTVQANIVSRPQLKIPLARKTQTGVSLANSARARTVPSVGGVHTETEYNLDDEIAGHPMSGPSGDIAVSGVQKNTGDYGVLNDEEEGNIIVEGGDVNCAFYDDEEEESSSSQDTRQVIKGYKKEVQFYDIDDLNDLVDEESC